MIASFDICAHLSVSYWQTSINREVTSTDASAVAAAAQRQYDGRAARLREPRAAAPKPWGSSSQHLRALRDQPCGLDSQRLRDSMQRSEPRVSRRGDALEGPHHLDTEARPVRKILLRQSKL